MIILLATGVSKTTAIFIALAFVALFSIVIFCAIQFFVTNGKRKFVPITPPKNKDKKAETVEKKPTNNN